MLDPQVSLEQNVEREGLLRGPYNPRLYAVVACNPSFALAVEGSVVDLIGFEHSTNTARSREPDH